MISPMARFLYPDPDLNGQPPIDRQAYLIQQLADYDPRGGGLYLPTAILALGGEDYAQQKVILQTASAVNGYINLISQHPERPVLLTVEIPVDNDYVPVVFKSITSRSIDNVIHGLRSNHQIPLAFYDCAERTFSNQEPNFYEGHLFGIKIDSFEQVDQRVSGFQIASLLMDADNVQNSLLYGGVVIYSSLMNVGMDDFAKTLVEVLFHRSDSSHKNSHDNSEIFFQRPPVKLMERLLNGWNPLDELTGFLNNRRRKQNW